MRGAFESEVALAHSLRGGDARARRVAWNQYSPLVRRIARRAFGPAPEVDDVTQEVFFRLFQRAQTLRNPEALRSFVAGFAFRIVRSERRRLRATRWLVLSETGFDADDERDAPGSEARFEIGPLLRVLDRLAAREREVFLLRHLEGMTLVEIADARRQSLATVKRILKRAAEKVRARVQRATPA